MIFPRKEQGATEVYRNSAATVTAVAFTPLQEGIYFKAKSTAGLALALPAGGHDNNYHCSPKLKRMRVNILHAHLDLKNPFQ
jgi:hypothetical protein